VLRNLPVPGAGQKSASEPVRWWDAATILADCDGLWLVPASAWFNPATGAEQWIFTAGAGPDAVAFNDPENKAFLLLSAIASKRGP
jgi:hypothetical protein